MASDNASVGSVGGGHELEPALRNLAHAVRALQLYPPTSPVVHEAIERAHAGLSPFLRADRLSLAILPDALRVGGDAPIGGGRPIRTLAERLHQRGVARLHLEPSLRTTSLHRLAGLLAADVDTLNDQGGISALCEQQDLEGVALEMLQLDKLYADDDEGAADPETAVWEQILGSYGADADLEDIDWHALADDPEQLADFLGWLLDEEAPPAGISEMSRLQIVRATCERVGRAAAELGPDRLDEVAAVFGGFYDALDKEVWVDLLGQPLEIETTGAAGAPDERALRADAAHLGAADIAQAIGASLDGQQVEDLLVYALDSRKEASARIFGLFRNLLEGRADRNSLELAIRDAVRRQATNDDERRRVDELWPRLADALHGEQMDDFVSTTYRAQMERLLEDAPLASLWDLDRISLRMRELEPGYLVQRKVKIILELVEAETDDDDYAALIAELERALPELIVDGQYIATEEILKALVADLDPSGERSDAQRAAAREILIRFCNEHTLREVVRNLAGRETTQIDAAARIFRSLGAMSVPALLEALPNEQSRPVRVHLVRMLSAIGEQALPEIRKHLRDKRWFFVRNLVSIIGEIGDPRFIPHLGIMVNHSDVRVRREAVRSMAKLRNDAAANVLLSAVDDEDPEVRLLAIRGLGTSGTRSAVPRLRELVRLPNRTGNNTDVIRAAAIALGRIGASEALADLKRMARRPWLFRSRRIAAREAAEWAIATLRGELTGEAPEVHPRQRPRPDPEPPPPDAAQS